MENVKDEEARPLATSSSRFANGNKRRMDSSYNFARRFTVNNQSRMSKPYLFIITLTIATVFGLLQLVFLSSNDSNTGIPATNKFSYSDKNSPYEQIWINSRLPRWATKSEQFTKIEDSITPGERICYVHVGKAG